MKATVKTNNQTFEIDLFPNKTIRDSLIENGLFVYASCNGSGRCGQCRVKLVSSDFPVEVDENGTFLTCKCRPAGNIVFELDSFFEFEIKYLKECVNSHVTLYLDLGTTTLSYAFVDENKDKICTVDVLNPQIVFGADVLSRINSCATHGVKTLQKQILSLTNCIIETFQIKNGLNVERLVVCGNTVMQHIFAGIDPQSIGVYPYLPVFLDKKTLSGSELGLPVFEVSILPSISGYLGSDVSVGILNVLFNEPENAIYLDLGTNGEIVLKAEGKYYCTSTAAGPALEGGNLSCGIGGVAGAVSSVFEVGPFFDYKTIGNVSPKGICGAGACDLVAGLLNKGIIDKNGKIKDSGCGVKKQIFYLTPIVYFTQSDVREFQLAKSAIRTGIDLLLRTANVSILRIKKIYFAGGLGSRVDKNNAFKVGLIPEMFSGLCIDVGNNALDGAIYYDENEKFLNDFLENVEVIDLTREENFEKTFIKNLNF